MKIGYIRLSKAGPTLAEQEAALEAAGVTLGGDAVYRDAAPKRRGGVATFDQQAEAIRALRPDDVLVFHSAPRLGTTEAQMREVAIAASAKGAVLFDCATGQEVRHHPDAGRLLAWAKAGAEAALLERTEGARHSVKRRYVAPKAMTAAKLTKARGLLADPKNSIRAVAEAVGVSSRTIYRAMEDGKLPKRSAT